MQCRQFLSSFLSQIGRTEVKAGQYFSAVRGYGSEPPPRPKQPPTAYLLYFNERHTSVRRQNPDMRQADLLKQIGSEWRTLDTIQKEEYIAQSVPLKERYLREKEEYENSLTEEQREEVATAAADKRKKRAFSKKKRLMKSLGKPKKPPGAYILFILDNYDMSQMLADKEKSVAAGMAWKELSDNEKERYTARHRESMERYEEDLCQWEDSIKDSHPQLLRTRRGK